MRRVLVTGASSGIGLACVRAFLECGDEVVAQYRRSRSALEQLEQVHGERLRTIMADLGDEGGAITTAAAASGAEVMVHSAGIWDDGAIRTLTRERLEMMFRVNAFSAYYLAREIVRSMKTGSMVFIGSTAGQRGEPGYSHYAGSKAAVWGLVQSLAQELAPRIRVNLVSPGWVRTPMAAPALEQPGRLERILAGVPLARIAEADEVASAVVFLAAERQRHITGIDLPISGGALLPLPRE